jgi:dUTP pyrophosphatase
MSLLVKKLSSNAITPSRGSQLSAGLDLYSPISTTIEPLKRLLVPIDIQIQVPHGTYGRIAGRSGLALKHGIQVLGGVIDADYRGNVGVILFNSGEHLFQIKRGDRIAQLVLEKYESVNIIELDSNYDLSETERDSGGFGSTGN